MFNTMSFGNVENNDGDCEGSLFGGSGSLVLEAAVVDIVFEF